jgi:choline kinase
MSKSNYIHNLKEENCHNSFIILSAGCGVRKRYSTPESLIKIGNNKLIDYQVNAIRKFDKDGSIFLVVGFLSDDVISYVHSKHKSVKIIENVNFKDMTSAGSLKLAVNLITDSNLYVFHGNRFFSKESFCVNDDKSPIVFIHPGNHKQGYNIGVLHQKEDAKHLSYGLKNEWSEMLFIPRERIKEIQKNIRQANSYEDIHKLVNVLIEKTKFKIQEHKKGKIIDVIASKGII